MEEPIRIFSDLHLGHPACRIESVEQLRPLLEGAGTVIFNGDTAEMRHRQLIESGLRQLGELKSLAEEMGVKLVFLRGNHDPEVSETDHLDLASGRVFLTHGDALFPNLSPWSPKVRKIQPQIDAIRAEYGEEKLREDLAANLECTHRCRELSPGYENEFKNGFLSTLRTLVRFAWPPQRPVLILHTWWKVSRLAHAFARRHRPDARFFLIGHTHNPGIWKKDGRVVVNTGGFISIASALGIEVSGDEVVIRKIREENGRIEFGEELPH